MKKRTILLILVGVLMLSSLSFANGADVNTKEEKTEEIVEEVTEVEIKVDEKKTDEELEELEELEVIEVEIEVDTGKTKDENTEDVEDIKEVIDINFYGEELSKLEILKGTNKGLELDSELTRVQGMLIYFRMLGLDMEDIEEFEIPSSPFDDIPEWAKAEIDYLYYLGLVRGVSETKLGANDKMTVEQFTTLVLRALGYNDVDGEDFVWNESLRKAVTIGLISEIEAGELQDAETFTRGYMSLIAYKALNTNIKDEEKTLLEIRREIMESVLEETEEAEETETEKEIEEVEEVENGSTEKKTKETDKEIENKDAEVEVEEEIEEDDDFRVIDIY